MTVKGQPCPLCSVELAMDAVPAGTDLVIDCLNCGRHTYTRSAMDLLQRNAIAPSRRAAAAHGVHKVAPDQVMDDEQLRRIASQTELPGAMERVDNLLHHLARAASPGAPRTLRPRHLCAAVGAESEEEAEWVVRQAVHAGFVEGEVPSSFTEQMGWHLNRAALTLQGWRRHDELMRSGAGSTHAFMAMKFGDEKLNAFYRDHLRPAVRQTGFDLRKTNDDHQTAGSIDARMRVEIHTSRFLICDLTHGNRGAYWEAGFAEGLRRPVIYVCRHDVLADKGHTDHPHFDTAHQLIVGWNPLNPSPGLEELKAVIRATMPAEAKMTDD